MPRRSPPRRANGAATGRARRMGCPVRRRTRHPGHLFLDAKARQPLRTDGFGNLVGGTDTQLVHTIAGASREPASRSTSTSPDCNDSALHLNGGVSSEPDYLSRFVGVGGQWDFDQKLTTLNASLNYTSSDISATLDHDAMPYIFNACGTPTCNFVSSTSRIDGGPDGGGKVLYGIGNDWAATVGRHAGPNAERAGEGESRLHAQPGLSVQSVQARQGRIRRPGAAVPGAVARGALRHRGSIMEKRPDLRKQWLLNSAMRNTSRRPTPAASQLRVLQRRLGHSRPHRRSRVGTAVRGGWMFTPMVRYYTQTAAIVLHAVSRDRSGAVHERTDGIGATRPSRSISPSCRPTIRATIDSPRSAPWVGASRSADNSPKASTASLGYPYSSTPEA